MTGFQNRDDYIYTFMKIKFIQKIMDANFQKPQFLLVQNFTQPEILEAFAGANSENKMQLSF